MSHPRTCGKCRIGTILSLYIIAAFAVATVSVESASPGTNFSFLMLPAADNFIFFGDSVQHDAESHSYTIAPTPYDSLAPEGFPCTKMYYKDKVRMKSKESNEVASFSTSFSFSITKHFRTTDGSGWVSHSCGFLFIIGKESTLTSLYLSKPVNYPKKFIAIEFDTSNDYITEDPSDNHIGVNVNSFTSAYTHNLCEGNNTTCSFPWNGRTYTAWIDYNGLSKSLEVWFANGSLREGVVKPLGSGLIKVDGLDLTDTFEELMLTGFSAVRPTLQTDPDSLTVLSWNFVSSFPEAMPTPTLMQSRQFSKKVLIICATCGPAILAVIYLLIYTRRIRQHPTDKFEPGHGLDQLVRLQRFSFKELKKATKNFNDTALLGKGGSGSVYKGIMTSTGMVVAVKQLKHDSEFVQQEFLAEVSSISQIRHRNLVHLLGWCHEGRHFLLVFEYMSNGSLDEWLFPSRRRHANDPKFKRFKVLPWDIRFSILAGVAAAVEYLHEEWVQYVLHRDIRSSNVMLDENFNAHLGDFGLARLMDHEKVEKTTMMAGTFGYMAPELHYTGKATKESDVYSFGTLLLEVLCGRRPVILQVEDPDENSLLVLSVWAAHEAGNILSAVDPGLASCSKLTVASNQTSRVFDSTSEQASMSEAGDGTSTRSPVVPIGAMWCENYGEGRVEALLHLGLHCCLSDPRRRPSMRVVKQVILEVQSSTAEGSPISALELLPPLPSAMPLLADLQLRMSNRQVTIAFSTEMTAALEEVATQSSSEMSTSDGGLRHRFVTM